MIVDKPDKPINWLDQFLHAFFCFVLTMLVAGSWVGWIVVVLWAITREYYQVKINVIEAYRIQKLEQEPSFRVVMDNLKLFKRDLKVSYSGVLLGNICVGVLVYFDLIKMSAF